MNATDSTDRWSTLQFHVYKILKQAKLVSAGRQSEGGYFKLGRNRRGSINYFEILLIQKHQ